MQSVADSGFDPIAVGEALAARRAASIAAAIERWRAWVREDLTDALALPDDAIEGRPGLFAWMFPTGAPSRIEPNAPRIGRRELAEAVAGDVQLHRALISTFKRVVRFLGLVEDDGLLRWADAPGAWTLSTLVDRRVYRMLRCLHVAGLGHEAGMLMGFLQRELGGDPRRSEALAWYRHQVAS